MVDDFEIDDLTNVYKTMDINGRKKMVQAAKKLLGGQLVLKSESQLLEFKNENTELKKEFDIL